MTAARIVPAALLTVAACAAWAARGGVPAGCPATAVTGRTASRAAVKGTVPSQCTDPCVQAAGGDSRTCASSVSGAFADALDGCLARDRQCVDACRWSRQSCRENTGLGDDVAACRVEERRAKDECRQRLPPGSTRQTACLHEARAEAIQCRRRATRRARRDLLACGRGFRGCASACGPGQPPGGVALCRAAGRSAAQSQLAGCKRTFQAAMAACLEKDLTCGLDCIDGRDACTAQTTAALDAALAACRAQEQSAAWSCRDAALTAARPGLLACVQPYAQCVKACPPAQAG